MEDYAIFLFDQAHILEKWINSNKISYEDLMIELARMS